MSFFFKCWDSEPKIMPRPGSTFDLKWRYIKAAEAGETVIALLLELLLSDTLGQ
jgi:hypothetical protein